jgi:hypothetical protein
MGYRVYSGPRGAEMTSPMDKEHLLFKEFSMLDDAVSWARHVNGSGRVALLIEGDDGTHLTKRDLAATLGGSGAEAR